MRFIIFTTTLYNALAIAVSIDATIDKSILDYLHNILAGGSTPYKCYGYTFFFKDRTIYANATDSNLLAKVTTRCYTLSKDVPLFSIDRALCKGKLVSVEA